MRFFLLALVLALLSSAGASAREQINLHLAFSSRTPLYGTLATRLVAEVAERSGGRLRLRSHEPGAMVPRFGYLDAVAQGAVDAAWGTPAVLSGRAPEAALFTGVPFGLDRALHLSWVRDGAGRALYDSLYARFGVIGLPCASVGPDGLAWLQAPLDEAAPFRGLRVRAFGLPARILDALGAGSAIGFGADLVVGLGTGAFDAAEASIPAADVAFGLHKVAPVYLYPSPIQPTTLLDLVINGERWTRLSADARATLVAACGATAEFAVTANMEMDAIALRSIVEAGVAVLAPSDATVDKLRAAWREVRDQQQSESASFAAVIRAYPLDGN